jgi:hypothetical protein
MTPPHFVLPDYVAAFRTYAWDDDIALLARRFLPPARPGAKSCWRMKRAGRSASLVMR